MGRRNSCRATCFTRVGGRILAPSPRQEVPSDETRVDLLAGLERTCMTAVVTRSQQSCSDNQKLLTRARDLIHVSRRALNPSWTITGASVDYASPHPTPDDPWTIRLAIPHRLARGSLFPAPKRACPRPRTGLICAARDIEISAH